MLRIKGTFDQMIGKRIKGIVVKESCNPPRAQVFLIFSDETHYEFYGENFRGTNGVDPGGMAAVKDYMADPERFITFEKIDEQIQ